MHEFSEGPHAGQLCATRQIAYRQRAVKYTVEAVVHLFDPLCPDTTGCSGYNPYFSRRHASVQSCFHQAVELDQAVKTFRPPSM